MADLYRHFGRDWAHVCDFSDQALIDHYNHVSYGTPVRPGNGFVMGEGWLDVNVAMWNEDISRGHLPRKELYDDEKYPHWWLDKVLK
jgi:hypothetical protein